MAINESDIEGCPDSFISDGVSIRTDDKTFFDGTNLKKSIPDFLLVPTKFISQLRKTRRLSDRKPNRSSLDERQLCGNEEGKSEDDPAEYYLNRPNFGIQNRSVAHTQREIEEETDKDMSQAETFCSQWGPKHQDYARMYHLNQSMG